MEDVRLQAQAQYHAIGAGSRLVVGEDSVELADQLGHPVSAVLLIFIDLSEDFLQALGAGKADLHEQAPANALGHVCPGLEELLEVGAALVGDRVHLGAIVRSPQRHVDRFDQLLFVEPANDLRHLPRLDLKARSKQLLDT